ncbi:MAG: hypothetical protein D6754_12115 [Alphaproteobacteria bacterium]|nr:MAG: hypothetical protein D6754_12115 [Alphaproteobacteria bacterium]
MCDSVIIEGIPTKAKADQTARILRLPCPDCTVEVTGGPSPAPYTVRRLCPAADDAATAASATAGSPTIAPPRQRPGVLGFLDFIANYESTGNYNARFGDAANQTDPKFTALTIDQVQAWQEGRKFSACGKYQIIRDTLRGLKASMNLSGAELYDEEMQDRMGTRLLEGRGLASYLSGGLEREDFALAVAREWAALPGVKEPFGPKGVYDGDGVNQARVDVPTYLAALDRLKSEAGG